MRLVVEGTDGTGKSTFLEGLETSVVPFGAPKAGWHEEYIERVLKAGLGYNDVALDRSFIGSRVWARVGLHPPVLDSEVWEMLCGLYAHWGMRVVVVIRDEAAICSTIDARPDEGEMEIIHALRGQEEFIELVLAREILYLPVALTSSDLMHYEPRAV